MKIAVVDNQIEPALKTLKKEMLKAGLFQGDEASRALREAVGETEAEAGRGAEEAAACSPAGRGAER